jgi:multifunctional methyltransferase subunit TRM112
MSPSPKIPVQSPSQAREREWRLTPLKLGFPTLPAQAPTKEELEADQKMMAELHTLLLETQISEGVLRCGNCGHEYRVKEGIANFLLPNHLV